MRDGRGVACDRQASSPSVERYLPNVTIDQRVMAAANGFDPRLGIRQFDPRVLVPQLDPRYGGDRGAIDPSRVIDPRACNPRYGGDNRYSADPRAGGDPRADMYRFSGDQGRQQQPQGDANDMYRFSGDQGRRPQGDPNDMYRFSGDRQGNPRDGGDNPGGGRDYTVKSGDSLWKIAKNALRESGQSASNRDIQNAIQQIVEANKAEHPGLATNPNLILDGWHLKVPIGNGSDRGNTRYGGRDAYFDQRDGRNDFSYGQGSGEFNGRRHSRGDWSGRQYGQDQYGRDQYGRDQYGRDQYGRDQYGRDQYGRDQNGYDQNGYDPYGRNRYGQGQYGDGNPYMRGQNQYGQDGAYDNNQPFSNVAMALKQAALGVAGMMGSIGRCAAGVQRAFAAIGQKEFLGTGDAWPMGAKMAQSGKFDVLPLSAAREGDVIVRSWNRSVIAQHGGRNSGDIVVVTGRDRSGNLTGANDHHGRIPPDGGRYCNSYVLRCRA